MKMPRVLYTLLALSIFDPAVAVAQQETVTSRVMSRSRAVTQVSDAAMVYRARRDKNDFSPLGAPARLRTLQTITAVKQSTG